MYVQNSSLSLTHSPTSSLITSGYSVHTHTHSINCSPTHTQSIAHLHTLTHSIAHLHTLTHSIAHLHTLTHSIAHLHTLTHSIAHLHTLTHSIAHLHTLTHSIAHLHTLTHSIAHLHTLTHSLTPHTLIHSPPLTHSQGELTALSQKHDDITYFPNVAQYKNIIQYKVKKFYDEHVKETLAERGSYVIDMFVSTEKVGFSLLLTHSHSPTHSHPPPHTHTHTPPQVYILRLSPFYTGTGACLFTWAEHGKLLTKPPVNFKIIDSAHKAPEIYSGLQSHWNSMLDSVLMQKQNEQRSQSGRGCTIL